MASFAFFCKLILDFNFPLNSSLFFSFQQIFFKFAHLTIQIRPPYFTNSTTLLYKFAHLTIQICPPYFTNSPTLLYKFTHLTLQIRPPYFKNSPTLLYKFAHFTIQIRPPCYTNAVPISYMCVTTVQNETKCPYILVGYSLGDLATVSDLAGHVLGFLSHQDLATVSVVAGFNLCALYNLYQG